MTDYANPSALVETTWLAEHLDDPSVRVVEVDMDPDTYSRGHIRGAVSWDWFRDLRARPRRDLIDQEGLTRLLRRAGLDPESYVILYGDASNWFAAYAYWLMQYRGFDGAKLLNGGRRKWESEGRELTAKLPRWKPGSITVSGANRDNRRAMREYTLFQVGHTRFIDVRSPEEYRGELLAPLHLPQEQAQVPGHIPGAVNIPWEAATNDDGTFKPAGELRAIYEAYGVTPESEVITYCRVGERSAHTWFVLHELLGYPYVRNYDGSWAEYGSLIGAPVEILAR
ncbi:MAG TPA: sulfurtransferase [Acidimicrobiales bacterium]|nr:sulfurtransferase [Acidimicrobiales bacterium]